MSPHVLILDADPSAAQVTRAGVARALPEATLDVEPTAERGWASAKAHQPDLVIVDPGTHNLGNLWLIQALRAANPHALIIVLASVSTPGLKRRLEKMGVDVYLEKPAPLTVLLAAVKDHMPPQRRQNGHGASECKL